MSLKCPGDNSLKTTAVLNSPWLTYWRANSRFLSPLFVYFGGLSIFFAAAILNHFLSFLCPQSAPSPPLSCPPPAQTNTHQTYRADLTRTAHPRLTAASVNSPTFCASCGVSELVWKWWWWPRWELLQWPLTHSSVPRESDKWKEVERRSRHLSSTLNESE